MPVRLLKSKLVAHPVGSCTNKKVLLYSSRTSKQKIDILERLVSERLIHVRKSELHNLVMRAMENLSLFPLRLFQGQEPLGFGAPSQVQLRAAEIGLDAVRALHLFDVLVVALVGHRVL